MQNGNEQKGFTLVEMLIVVLIVIIAAVVITRAFSGYGLRQSLIGASDTVASVIEEAQSRTLSSVSSMQYGVHVEEGSVILFSGPTYSPSDPNNEVHNLNSRVMATSSLSGGAVDIVFDRLSGETTQSGTVTVSLTSDASETRVINIQPTGIVFITKE